MGFLIKKKREVLGQGLQMKSWILDKRKPVIRLVKYQIIPMAGDPHGRIESGYTNLQGYWISLDGWVNWLNTKGEKEISAQVNGYGEKQLTFQDNIENYLKSDKSSGYLVTCTFDRVVNDPIPEDIFLGVSFLRIAQWKHAKGWGCFRVVSALMLVETNPAGNFTRVGIAGIMCYHAEFDLTTWEKKTITII